MNLLTEARTIVMYRHARSGVSEKLEARGWVPIEIGDKPWIFEPSQRGVSDLMSLLRDHGHDVKILAKSYIVTNDLNMFPEEAIEALREHWGSGLLMVTPDTFAAFERTVEKLPCRGIPGVPQWIRLRWKEIQGFVAQCKHKMCGKMKKCHRCPLRNGKLLEVSQTTG